MELVKDNAGNITEASGIVGPSSESLAPTETEASPVTVYGITLDEMIQFKTEAYQTLLTAFKEQQSQQTAVLNQFALVKDADAFRVRQFLATVHDLALSNEDIVQQYGSAMIAVLQHFGGDISQFNPSVIESADKNTNVNAGILAQEGTVVNDGAEDIYQALGIFPDQFDVVSLIHRFFAPDLRIADDRAKYVDALVSLTMKYPCVKMVLAYKLLAYLSLDVEKIKKARSLMSQSSLGSIA